MKFQIYFFYHIRIYNDFWNSIQIINWTALMFASVNGCTEIVRLLLSKPNIEINTKNILYQNIHNIRIFFFFHYIQISFFHEIQILFFHYIQILFFLYNSNFIFSLHSNLIFFIGFKSYFFHNIQILFFSLHSNLIFFITFKSYFS